jgi:endonuclease YncB( thermonuclease family)
MLPQREGRLQLLLATRRLSIVAIPLLLAGLASAGRLVLPSPFEGRVVGVIDGDSVTILKDGRERVPVRLEGVDSPELGQDFGRRAKEFTRDLVLGRVVNVQPTDFDRYGRTVARVWIEGRDVSVEIVRAGYAWHFLRYSSDPVLDAAEKAAREVRRGLWAQQDAVAPWEFRVGGAPLPTAAAPAPTAGAAFVGNTSSHVFHRVGCRHYGCHNCTRQFQRREEAIAAGFRPAGCCRP